MAVFNIRIFKVIMANSNILALDVGGSNIKAAVLDPAGEVVQDYIKEKTPEKAYPENIMESVDRLVTHFVDYERVSVGFPGVIKHGRVFSAPNLGNKHWHSVPFAEMLSNHLSKPVKIANDADVHALGVAKGKGFEMVITLGTGFGTAFLDNGRLLPHIELAHHPLKKGKDYDEYLGKKELKRIGEKKWNKRLKWVLEMLEDIFNCDTLYIGGGSADKITFPLGENVRIFSNREGIRGGALLWQQEKLVEVY